VLQLCVRFGAADANPIPNVSKVRKGRQARPRALSTAEEVDLIKRVGGGAGAGRRQGDEADLPEIVRSLRGTGCRIGEVLAVRRDVVDLDAGVVEINATVVRIAGRGSVLQERAKSDAGWRVIAVPGELVELVELWRARMELVQPFGERLVWVVSAGGQWRQVPCHELGLLYPSIEGRIRNPSNVERGLRAVLDRAAPGVFDWVVPHTFRRTVATRLDEAGASARQIADHLGHERPSMTQDVYMGPGVAFAGAAQILTQG
jgi:integrase